ncbi:MAG TPA: deoxyribose-phosphate aldolase [Anaeromyxobacteraceae bacterium]|nr:deoxyribose-phosphate aldolase [Anaeromyxobacteraceae bacterium]
MPAPLPLEAIRTPADLAPYLDHTLLASGASRADLERLCDEARRHGFAAVCVHGDAVADAKRLLRGSGVLAAAVVDFPRGEGATAARVAEAVEAVRAGADEIDLVAPLPALLSGRAERVLEDLRAVVRAAAVPVKVILETSRLDRDGKVVAAALARCAGAAFVKTSTGFGGGGATVEDVALLRAVVGDGMGVKASGGIRTAADARAMIVAGASRIGSSQSVAIVTGAFRP